MKKLIFILVLIGIMLLGVVATLFLKIEKSPVESLEETTVRIEFEGEFEIGASGTGEPHLSWVAVQSLNYPEASEYLEIIEFGASEPYTVSEDNWNNHYVTLNFSNPIVGVNKYQLWTTVKVKKIVAKTLSQSLEIIPKEFMNANKMVQSTSPIVKQLATELTQESTSQYSKVKDVSEWVYANIVYDIALETVTMDAVWTLENKRGVCVEIAHLTEALLRSLDIPTRHVYGAAPYNYPVGWQEHTWIEAYIGKWVPIDPTWDETTYLDPAHVAFARVPDQTFVEEKVSVSGRNIKMGGMILPKMTVEILDEKRGKEPLNLNLFGKKLKLEGW